MLARRGRPDHTPFLDRVAQTVAPVDTVAWKEGTQCPHLHSQPPCADRKRTIPSSAPLTPLSCPAGKRRL
jgi:hypothetical protein